MTNVTFGGLNTANACDNLGGGGYSFFTSPVATVTAGALTPYSISTGGDVEGAAMWIDYNQDGIFSPSEMIFNGFAGTNPATYSGNTTIPLTAINGTTRMRVRCTYFANPNSLIDPPCTNATYGETEDYNVTITGGVSPITYVWNPGGLSGASVSVTPGSTTTYTVTATATATGCTNTATTTVTFLGTAPTVTCPSNQTANANASCQAVVSYTATTSAGTFSYVFSGATTGSGAGTGSGSTFNRGVTTVILTATSGSCSANCSFTVTVNDVTGPVITVPANISVSNTLGACSAPVSYTAPTATDNCLPSTVNFNYLGAPVAISDFVTSTATITASGLMPSLGTTTSLNSVCINLTHTFDGDLTINLTSPLGTVYNLSTTNGGGGDNYTNTCFNMSAGTPITAGAPPFTGTFIPQGGGGFANFNGQNPNGVWTLSIADGVGGDFGTLTTWSLNFTNISPTILQTVGLSSGSTFPVGATTNTFVATDASGNTSTSSFTVTVNDTQNPTISCPANISVNNNPGTCAATVTYTAPVGTDNCPSATTTQIAGLASGASFPVGTTTNTFRVTDASANTATCSFTVTVTDNQAPTVTAPNTVDLECATDLPAAQTTIAGFTGLAGASASDNCTPTGSLTISSVTGPLVGTSCNGTITRTYTITDAASNSTNRNHVFTVTDNTAPTLTGAPYTGTTGTNACMSNATTAAPFNAANAALGYSDNCSGVTASLTGTVVTGTDCGWTVTYTYSILDVCGNALTNRSYSNTGSDQTPPSISCPANITQNAIPLNCGRVITYSNPTGSDNCSGVVITQTDGTGYTSGQLFPVGVTTLIYTATDVCGNTSSCSFTITIVDTQNPIITSCPSNITQSNAVGQCNRVVSWVAPTASDNCPGVVMTSNFVPGSTFPVGTTTVIYTATDVSSNTSTCSFTVTVVDTENPIITCPSNIIVGNDVGSCGAIVSFAASATDNCSAVVTYSQNPGTSFPVGITTVTATATDPAGNTAMCTFTVTVNDTQTPTISCNAPIVVSNAAGTCGATVGYTVTSADNCSGQTVVQTGGQASGTVFPVGTTTNSFTVTDASGNTATCSFTVTVNDTEAPTITCNTPITVSNDAGVCGAMVTYSVTTSDNCATTITQTAGLASGSTFPIGTTTNSFIVTDPSGNTATCSFTVTVNDTQVPVISGCPSNISVNNDLGVCGAMVTFTNPTASDNCSFTFTQTAGLPSGSIYPTGTTNNVFTATDASGNITTCSFTVTVTDTEAPVITCPTPIVINNDPGICGAVVTFADATATDNCGSSPIELVTNGGFESGFTGWTVGTNWFINDGTLSLNSGNASTPPINGLFDIVTNQSGPGLNIVSTPMMLPGALTSVVLSWKDRIRNNAVFSDPNQEFRVELVTSADVLIGTVYSTNPGDPTVQFGPNIRSFDVTTLLTPYAGQLVKVRFVEQNNLNYFNVNVDDVSLLVGGGVAVAQTAGLPSGSTFPVGTSSVTYVATDGSGNSTTCSFTVTVNDTELPVVTCPGNMPVNTDPGACGATVTYSVTSSDNCANTLAQTAGLASGSLFPVGTTVNTFMVTDASGNTSTCSFNVVVTDNQAPSITCNAPITVNNDLGICGANVSYSVTSSDNCASTLTQTAGLSSGSTFPVGTTTNSFIVTDASGNTATCSFTVTVNDNEAPVPTVASLPNATGVCSVTITAPTSTDNCVGTVTATPASVTYSSGGTFTQTWTYNDGNGNISTQNQTVIVSSPEADITGNGNSILHTSSAYSLTNHTDFGSVPECSGTMSRTYTIANIGIGTLNLTGTPLVKVTGLNPGDFVVTSLPASSIAPGGSTTFTVTFNPSAPGNRYARFTINNDDCNESGYYFQVRGVGTGSDVTAAVPTVGILPNVTGSCSATVSTVPTANDACAGLITGTTASPLTYNTQGTYTVVWSYNDGNGNISTQTQTVIVQDLTPPTAICQPSGSVVLELDITGNGTLTASMINNGSSDNCGPLTYIGIFGAIKVTNGTFNTNLSGWSVANGTMFQSTGGNPGGFAWLNGTGGVTDPLIQQTFNDLVPGQTYVIRGDYRSVTGPGSFPGQVAFGIDLDGTQIATKGLPNPITAWTPFSVTFVATAATHTVRFRGEINGTDGDIALDNVRIDGTAKKYNCFTRGVNNVTLIVQDAYGNISTCNSTVTVQSTINPCPFTLDITNQVNASGEENTNNEEGTNTTSIGSENTFDGKLYPNPSNGIFNLELSILPRGNSQIKVIDALGQVLYNNVITSQNTYYDFSYLRAATYYVQVITDEGSFTKQIVITHGY